jgi:hypothetical protein
MSADKHFNQHGVLPKSLDDYRPDDMPSARIIIILVVALLVVCTVIAAIIYGKANPGGDARPAQSEKVIEQ